MFMPFHALGVDRGCYFLFAKCTSAVCRNMGVFIY